MLLQEYFQLYLWLAQYFLWTVCHRSLHSSLNGEWVCGHMCAWMCGSMCAGGGAYMCACRRSGWDTECLTLTFLHSLRQDLSLNLEVAYLAKSTGQYAPTISASPALGFHVCGLAFLHGFWGDQTWEPCCSANTLLSESSPEVPQEGTSSERKQNLKFNSSVTLATVLSLRSHV